jgi:hypothetical protein
MLKEVPDCWGLCERDVGLPEVAVRAIVLAES